MVFFLAAKDRRFDHVSEVLHIEAQTALTRLELAISLGYNNVVLESDSCVLVDLIVNYSSRLSLESCRSVSV